ncbi:hypothetical protein KUTeg_002506 [Tegillarca granosa]|uniref:MAGUK p55 subfamily member 6-like n=1 Tax=Tegillarca granosa TaxID=220873 RepID=A0ABQ9FUI1_TEGGR|nr:hypothetical protein KUTeg_002506 [Tegillarca granosa]
MPAATSPEADSGLASVQQLRSSLDELINAVGADDEDIEFLKDFLDEPVVQSLVQAHDRLDDQPIDPPSADNAGKTLTDVLNSIGGVINSNRDAGELDQILSNQHIQALLRAYDDIADKNYEDEQMDANVLHSPPPPVFDSISDQHRLVGIRKDKSAPLGITVKIDENLDLVIARIMAGSMIDKQGLLHVGDIIKEVNGIPVSTPEQLMEVIKHTDGGITLKIVPTITDSQKQSQLYLKAHFNYDPERDRLIPCQDAGLSFQEGDILQILSSEDPNWWQARIVSENQEGQTGLIPSKALEEKRKAYVQPEYDYSKSSLLCGLKRRKKKKIKYASKNNKDFDTAELMIYEEVTRMPPFERKTLVLVGANGVGRRALKERLLKDDPRRFGAVMPHTSRAPRDGEIHGKGYFFTDRETMEEDIKKGLYLEYGEFNGNLYGTQINSIHHTTKQGKMCVLDVSPTCLKVLRTTEFMPFVVFVAAPTATALREMYDEGRRRGLVGHKGLHGPGTIEVKSEDDFLKTVEESAQIERVYHSYFDMVLVNDDFDETYRSLRRALDNLSTEGQWVPVNWVY